MAEQEKAAIGEAAPTTEVVHARRKKHLQT